ncbi:ACT domain-containing protein [Thermogladius sp. 4427co]|uniref:ACT domain-containing protein n=1 Tax=Thermogladius sp. 4427co TaxID=3450718 RepID=UPI003F795C4E
MVNEELGLEIRERDCKHIIRQIEKYIESLPNLDETSISRLLANTSVELKTDLAVASVSLDAYNDVISSISAIKPKARFLSIVYSASAITIIIDREHYGDLSSLLKPRILYENTNISALILISPEDVISTPGFTAFITSLLAIHGINVLQLLSCHKDTILIVENKDSLRAFELLNTLVSRNSLLREY